MLKEIAHGRQSAGRIMRIKLEEQVAGKATARC